MGGTGYTVKNDRVQDAIPAHGWRLGRYSPKLGKDFDQENLIGQDKLGRRRCFAAPGRCRHARAVYELAHNLMRLDMA